MSAADLSLDEELDDDQDAFDQLRSIKPFTVEQLYQLHPDVGRPLVVPPRSSLFVSKAADNVERPPPTADTATTTNVTAAAVSLSDAQHDKALYEDLVDYEQLRYKLSKLKKQVKHLHRKTFDHIEQVWVFKEEAPRKIGMCQQGKIAETTLKYKQAFVDRKQLNLLNSSFHQLAEVISKEYMYYSFESLIRRHKTATKLSSAYQIQDEQKCKENLRLSIVTLIDFTKHLGAQSKSNFVLQCRKWLRGLIKRFLDLGTPDDRRFIIAQLCKGPPGTADWSADLIECKPFDKVVHQFESASHYITHCAALLGELFVNLRYRVRRKAVSIGANFDSSSNENENENTSPTHNWSLVDPRFSCSEELNLCSSAGNTLSECDVIKFCLRIPLTQIFASYVKQCLKLDESSRRDNCYDNYQSIMLKLLTLGTLIIKTYQIGLETFNSIIYGNLIEYLSSQIRGTVIALSDQWLEFKRRLKGVDDALLMRLQVEYDNFILRSILVIFELRESGIWRHLSKFEPDLSKSSDEGHGPASAVGWSSDNLRPALAKLLQVTGLTGGSSSQITSSQETNSESSHPLTQQLPKPSSPPNSLTYGFSIEWFKEVSEPMLWHILWQFYHNAFVNSCDYHSDVYWLEKFQDKSVIYLFINKIRDSPPGECTYLLNSITSMVLSRPRQDSKLVNFVATELFNLSFKHPNLKEKVTQKGIKSLLRCAARFPHLISLFLEFMADETFDISNEDTVELIRDCSLRGWLCSDEEFSVIPHWLIELPIQSPLNRVARILITKMLLNSPKQRLPLDEPSSNQSCYDTNSLCSSVPATPSRRFSRHQSSSTAAPAQPVQRFVNLRLRRRLAILLFEASVKHAPPQPDPNVKSLSNSVELSLGGLFCEHQAVSRTNLIELASENTYQQFYVWVWRLLFIIRPHILNQAETDWNDVQSRSGVSKSIKNTVLIDDSFHPAPSLQDTDCLTLVEGIQKQNSMAAFVALYITDVTWQADTLGFCIEQLNVMVQSGHLTPSLMSMKHLTICHLNSLADMVSKDQRFVDYFLNVIQSNFDATRLASMITYQMNHLKQYRQLQLSQFYIAVLLELASIIIKRQSSSWFANGTEYALEKVAYLLDHIVKFNFTTQRIEIIRKFRDCAYSIQYNSQTQNSWLGSLLTTNSSTASTRREFLTTLHALTQKFKQYNWLRWVTTECDTLRLEKIWEDLVLYLSCNEDASLDLAIEKVCPQVNPGVLKSILPIHSWTKHIFDVVEHDLGHPLCPMIWYNFFVNYFANSLNGVSVGRKIVPHETLTLLIARLDSLANYHLYKQRKWVQNETKTSSDPASRSSLAQLYRAYRLWLQDSSLQDAYVDTDRLRDDYLKPIFKAVMELSTGDAILPYIDLQSIDVQNRNLSQIWANATQVHGSDFQKEMIFVDVEREISSTLLLTSAEDEASDAINSFHLGQSNSLLPSEIDPNLAPEANKALINAEEELKALAEAVTTAAANWSEEGGAGSFDEVNHVKRCFQAVFEESYSYQVNMRELDKMRDEIVELIQQLWINKKREHLRVVACADGLECAGPARIKFEVEEATLDDRKSDCIQDRQRQYEELVEDLLQMPSMRIIQATISIEESVRRLINDPNRAKAAIATLLAWVSESDSFNHLSGVYYVANHLLKSLLELLSTNEQEVDTFNISLTEVSIDHPGSVHEFSPFLTPSRCTPECFLKLYKRISSSQAKLGPIALFVLLSKFDLGAWLQRLDQAAPEHSHSNKLMFHDIIRTTCEALRHMGKQPDDSFALTFDIYRRHLAAELISPHRRRFEEILLLLEEFLRIMDEQLLAPSLWVDFMTILGFENQLKPQTASMGGVSLEAPQSGSETPSKLRARQQQQQLRSPSIFVMPSLNAENDESMVASIIEELARLAEKQRLFDFSDLSKLLDLIGEFIQRQHQHKQATLLELYSDYLNQFSVVMVSCTLMWIKLFTDHYPDDTTSLWRRFTHIWNDWVYLTKNCQQVGRTHYSLIASQYVACIRYALNKLPPEHSTSILQLVLSDLTSYVTQTCEVVYLELTILQRHLKGLPWSELVASADDFDRLAAVSAQENFNVSDLISHVLTQINLEESLAQIQARQPELTPLVAERIAVMIVRQSTHLKSFRLSKGSVFGQIPLNRLQTLAALILPRMEFANLEHNQNNKLLVNLLRISCIRIAASTNGKTSQSLSADTTVGVCPLGEPSADECIERALVYARFVSDYLVSLICQQPNVLQYSRGYLRAVVENSLQDLSQYLLSAGVPLRAKARLYKELMGCCNNGELLNRDEGIASLQLIKFVIRSQVLLNSPIALMELLNSVDMVITNARVLVYSVDRIILLYLKMNGHYEKVLKSFALRSLRSDLYLRACVDESAPLALLVYFETLITELASSESSNDQGNEAKIWASFFHWASQLTLANNHLNEQQAAINLNDLKLAIVWLRLIELLEAHLEAFIHCHRATITAAAASSVLASSSVIDSSSSVNNLWSTTSDDEANNQPEDAAKRDSPTVTASSGTSTLVAQRTPARTPTFATTDEGPASRGEENAKLLGTHRALVEFVRRLASAQDGQAPAGLWAYLKSTPRERELRHGLVAHAIACFVASRSLSCLAPQPSHNTLPSSPSGDGGGSCRRAPGVAEIVAGGEARAVEPFQLAILPPHLVVFKDEMLRQRKACLTKLEAAHRQKSLAQLYPILESVIESAHRCDKVQYSEGVQLIVNLVKALYGSSHLSPAGAADNVTSGQAAAAAAAAAPAAGAIHPNKVSALGKILHEW